ncbi:MAG: hypothetical protein AUK36_09200 [Zetaproteobacteria bacterium CG2_30_59_37]|nr:MAG: hypothetical protein AUK36_09200 [Zetaproteobacteria bacterium CG2_30_59_37]
MTVHFLDTPEGGFSYVIERRARRRTVGIRVRSDGQVLVAVPLLVPHLYVKRVLRDKAGWVRRKLVDAAIVHQHKASRGYAEGDTVSYLGREYRLCFASRSRLDEAAGVLHLGMRGEPTREAVIAALTRWYRKQASSVLSERVGVLSGRLGKAPSHIGIKSYRTRWGSCHADGRIYFNWRLLMAPLAAIDYVAAHELCHLLHPNHSTAFWHEVEKLFPACKQQRQWLRRHGRLLDL